MHVKIFSNFRVITTLNVSTCLLFMNSENTKMFFYPLNENQYQDLFDKNISRKKTKIILTFKRNLIKRNYQWYTHSGISYASTFCFEIKISQNRYSRHECVIYRLNYELCLFSLDYWLYTQTNQHLTNTSISANRRNQSGTLKFNNFQLW